MRKQSDNEQKVYGMAADLRIIASDIAIQARRYEDTIADQQAEIDNLRARVEELQAKVSAP